MTQNDIIQMAREAGIHVYPEFGGAFKRFYALAVAAEREACAKLCESHQVETVLRGGVKQLAARCLDDGTTCDGDTYAAAIRARSNS